MTRRTNVYLTLTFVVLVAACATSPLGRSQLLLLPSSQMDSMGAEAFTELKEKTPIDTDPATVNYVRCVANPLIQAASGMPNMPKAWEIEVFRDDTANAFALPGGKIGVHRGLLPVAKTPGQLAAVIGHEIGHVIAQHGNERVSESLATMGGLAALDAILGGESNDPKKGTLLALLGLGAQFGVLLPHSRGQESEADIVGLDLMARAGFDPKQSVELWKNMMAASGGSPPEFLSTHPSGETRIQSLTAKMGESNQKFEAARAAGRNPVCAPPG